MSVEAARAYAPTRVLVVVTDTVAGSELIDGLGDRVRDTESTQVLVIAPAVERTAFRHVLGDVDAASEEAGRRLEISLRELNRAGIAALGQIGDSDPLVAAEDALRQFGADEVLVVARAEDQARWFEHGLFERVQEELRPAVRLVAVRHEEGESMPHLASVEESLPGRRPGPGAERELSLSSNLPQVTRGDLTSIIVAIVGTIAVIVLAATGPGAESAGGAAQILIAMGVALINMAHVVGLTLLESVHARGGLQRFFRNLSMTATPLAVLANGLITLLG